MRLDKFLSNLKYGSRKTIKVMVKNNQISIGDKLVTSSEVKINPNYDKILVKGEEVFYKESITLAFYKPAGYISSHVDEVYPSLFNLIKAPYNRFDLKIAGRLDYDSEGLMILTTQGDLVHKITHPKKQVVKVYEATLDNMFTDQGKMQLLDGVTIKGEDGIDYKGIALDINYEGKIVHISIDEGKFHQVKKMFRAVGFEVVRLKRLKIGQLELRLEPGDYIEILESDIFGR